MAFKCGTRGDNDRICFESRHHSEQVFPIYPGIVPDTEFGKQEIDSPRSPNQTPQTLLLWSNSSFSLGSFFLSFLVGACVIRIGRRRWSFKVKAITSELVEHYCPYVHSLLYYYLLKIWKVFDASWTSFPKLHGNTRMCERRSCDALLQLQWWKCLPRLHPHPEPSPAHHRQTSPPV